MNDPDDFSSQLPLSAEELITRGVEYANAGDYENGIADFTEAIGLNSDLTFLAYKNRGVIYFKQGNYENALADLTEAIRLKPDFEFAYNDRGEVYLAQNDNGHAIADFTEAINSNPVYARALYNRFSAYFNVGDYEKAVSDHKRAIERDYGIAGTFHKKINFVKVITDLETRLQSEPDNAEVRRNLEMVQNLYWFAKGPPKRQGSN